MYALIFAIVLAALMAWLQFQFSLSSVFLLSWVMIVFVICLSIINLAQNEKGAEEKLKKMRARLENIRSKFQARYNLNIPQWPTNLPPASSSVATTESTIAVPSPPVPSMSEVLNLPTQITRPEKCAVCGGVMLGQRCSSCRSVWCSNCGVWNHPESERCYKCNIMIIFL